jgi:hypothetical protein
MKGSTKGQKLFNEWPCLRTPFTVHFHTEMIFLNSTASRGPKQRSLSVDVVKGSTTEHPRLANKSLKTLDITKYSDLGWLDPIRKFLWFPNHYTRCQHTVPFGGRQWCLISSGLHRTVCFCAYSVLLIAVSGSKYTRTQLIRIKRDGEASGNAGNPNNWIFQLKWATTAVWISALTIYSMYLRLNFSTTPALKF